MTDAKQAALHRVLATIAVLGQAETRDIATQAGMAYSTLTPKLRALESDGLVERVTEAGTSRWQLTASGVLAAAVISDATEADDTLPLDTETERPDVDDTATGHPQTQDTDAGTEDADIDEDGPEGAADAVQIAAADTDRAAEAELADEATLRRAEADHTAEDTDDDDADGDREPEAELTGTAADPELGAEEAAVAHPHATSENTGETATDHGAQDEPADAPATDRDTAAVPEAGDAVSATSAAEAEDTAKPRRRGGTLREAALAALRKLGPSKVGAVCKAIDEANAGTGAAKASPGAVRNALDKLTEDGHAALVAEKPATFDAV